MQFIVNRLNLLQSSAQDLMERYLWELSEQQKYLQEDNYSVIRRRELHISVGYLIDQQLVEVSIIQAKNLPGRSKSSLFTAAYM